MKTPPPANAPTLFLLRGMPKSGRSTLATIIALGREQQVGIRPLVLSVKAYCEEAGLGPQTFDGMQTLLPVARNWMLTRFLQQMEENVAHPEQARDVIIDDYHVRHFELKDYLDAANKGEQRMVFNVIRCESQFGQLEPMEEVFANRLSREFVNFGKLARRKSRDAVR